jgi:ribonuclease HI
LKPLEIGARKSLNKSDLSRVNLFRTSYSHTFHIVCSGQVTSETQDFLDHGIEFKHGVRSYMSIFVAHVDGGSHGNPGPSGIGVVIQDPDGEKVRISKWIGHQDNNVAEYVALLEALQYALALKAKVLRVFSDSQVVVRQMTGEYACRSPRLYSLHWTCRKLARALDFSISHIDREDNSEANQLAFHAVSSRRPV